LQGRNTCNGLEEVGELLVRMRPGNGQEHQESIEEQAVPQQPVVAVPCRQKEAALMAYHRFRYACCGPFTVCLLVRPTRRLQPESLVWRPRRLR